MDFRTRQVALAAAVSLAGAGAIFVPQAIAAPTKVKAGRATLTITAKSKKALKRNHIKLTAGKPGSAKGRSYRLPVKGGSYDFRTNRGTVTQGGSLRLKRGRRSVTISAIKITLGKTSKVVAKVGGKRITLAVLSRQKQRVKSSGANRSVANIRVRVSAKAAKRLNAKLGRRAFTGRAQLASMTVLVRKPGTGAAGTQSPPASSAKLSMAPGVSQALDENGLAPSALPGSERLPDGSIDLPVTSAQIDPQTGSETVDLAGGLTLGSGSNAVTLDHPQIVLGGSEQGFYANVNGVRVKLAELDKSGLSEAVQSGAKQFSDLLATLTPEGAATLNQLGGVSLFVPGTPFGDLGVTLPSS
jgi:hypothetical protein